MSSIKRKLTTENSWQNSPIDCYVHDVGIVWQGHDQERSLIDVWLRVVRHASQLGELVRRGNLEEAQGKIARVAIWMLTFVARSIGPLKGHNTLFAITKPISEALWMKYPNCCPVCHGRRVTRGEDHWDGSNIVQCNCILTMAETEDRNIELTPIEKLEARNKLGKYANDCLAEGKNDYGVISLKELEERFEKIFRRTIFALDLEHVTFHFLEEVGEVTESLIYLYTYDKPKSTPPETLSEDWKSRLADLEGELADSFSWLFSVSSKLRDVFKIFDKCTGQTTFADRMFVSEHLGKRHMHPANKQMKCFDCGSTLCSCPIKLILDDESAEKISKGK